jgi:hypothetical protein
MAPKLSWNEIKKRAIEFSKEWEEEARESAEAKSFWDGFFYVFGVSRRRVASFEEPVKKLGNKQGFIDLFWKGNLIVEHKSRGKSLEKAYTQALDYFPDIKEEELPKYVLASDFGRFRLYDLEENTQYEFPLKDLHKYIELFGFIAGYYKKTFEEEDPVNVKAATIMGKLHDRLFNIGYQGHELEVFLVRILFCLFGEDTGIFERGAFMELIEERTHKDGSDLGARLAELFQVLDTPPEKRFSNLDENLKPFKYINGKLYEENIRIPSFDSSMRAALLEAGSFDWSAISPAVFGSLFQSIMDQKQRRNLGAHYTSERNIMKLIKPLFLEELWEEFNKIKTNKKKLEHFHEKLATLKFLDPACGCGNFLVISYRELRLLELEILKILHRNPQRSLNIEWTINSKVNVTQFYGIEIEEWPAKIAEVAMWLMDHQMNVILSKEFGQYYARLPLKQSANILHGNALQTNWETIIPKTKLNYILGNPPFSGKQYQTKEQKDEMKQIFKGVKGTGVLDFVTAWYLQAAKYIQNTKIKVAFVSTNSISQGEQVGILWEELFNKYRIKIHFAHRTFQWNNMAKGKAAVHVVIIGFAAYDVGKKLLYEYESIKGEPHEAKVANINPYLVQGKDVYVLKRRKPLCKVGEMSYGSMPNDGGHLILSDEEYRKLIEECPSAKIYIRRFVMGYELINNVARWCLWLHRVPPEKIKKIPCLLKRIEAVRNKRLSSTRKATRQLASTPYLFGEIRQPKVNYIALPAVSSETRKYVPIEILNPEIIAGNKVFTIPDSNLYYFGMLTANMHMTWMRHISGKLKSDYNYSNLLVYNNFPWPKNPTEAQKQKIEKLAQDVLDTRKKYPQSSLADLYDPLTMPPDLVRAHKELDKAVDKAYRPEPFETEQDRIEYLFNLYEEYTTNESNNSS